MYWQMNGQTKRGTEGHTDGNIDRQTEERQTNKSLNVLTDRQTD